MYEVKRSEVKWSEVKVIQSCSTLLNPMDYTEMGAYPNQWEVLTLPFPGTYILKIHKRKVFEEFLALPEVKQNFSYFIIIYSNYTHISSSRPLFLKGHHMAKRGSYTHYKPPSEQA